MKILSTVLIFSLVFVGNLCWGRSVAPSMPPQVITIAASEMKEAGVSVTAKPSSIDRNLKALSFLIPDDIDGHGITAGEIELFSNAQKVASFPAVTIELRDFDSYKKNVNFSVNPAVVTLVVIKFYCADNHLYRIEVPIADL